MKRRIVLFALLCTVVLSYAQQDAQYTQYMYNTIHVNPAYAGSQEALSMFALYRTQWVGLDGAPVTSAMSINTPFNNSNLGLGVSVISDKLGPTTENTISADLSYTIAASDTWKLSIGLKATANLFDVDATNLTSIVLEPRLQNYSKFSPNIGAGVYCHSNNAYIGLSVPNFVEVQRYNDNEINIFKERMGYYLIGGYVFDLSDGVKFKPSFLTKAVQGAPVQVDISGNFMFNKKFTTGVAYRWRAALSALVGFQVSDGLYIGYGYDRETTSLVNYNSGSHEIFLRYETFKNNNKIASPRFF